MKNSFFLFVFTISMYYAFSQTSVYHPLPESDTYWQYTFQDIPEYCPCVAICHYDQFKISGDTLISGETYHKLVESRISLTDNCEAVFHYIGYQGAYRNDIENKKVWFVPDGEENEELLYEFDIQIGDTLSQGILNPEGYYYFVENIDSIEIGNNYRKRFIINWEYTIGAPYSIIEGIGGQNLIEPFESWFNFEAGYTLRCFNNNDSIVFPANCELISSDKDVNKLAGLEIFPNPTHGKFWIKKIKKNASIIQIDIYNVIGEKIAQYSSSDPLFEIDISENLRGIYFIKINSGLVYFTRKIILE